MNANTAILTFRTGWIIPLVGFILLGVCGFILFVAGEILLTKGASFVMWQRGLLVAAATLPLAGAVLGLLLVNGGHCTRIDGERKEVRIAHGLLIAWLRERKPFDAFQRVGVGLEVSSGQTDGDGDRHGGSACYPVRLEADGAEIEVSSPMHYAVARARAEAVANLMDLPLRDWSSPTEIEREAGHLDESLRERIARSGETLTLPKLPRNSKLTFEQHGDELVIDQPRIEGKERWSSLIGILVLGAFWSAAAWPAIGYVMHMLRSGDAPSGATQWVMLLLSAVPIAPVLYLVLGGLLLAFSRERIIVNPRTLRRVWLFPVGRYTRRLAGDKIEDLYIEGEDVFVRTDKTKLRMGLMLRKAERQWMKDAIAFGLCSASEEV